MIVWNRKLLAATKKILHHHTSLAEALPDIARATGVPVTLDSLANAFKRHGEGTPASFLKAAPKGAELTPREELYLRVQAKDRARQRKAQGMTEIVLEKVDAALCKIAPDVLQVVREPQPDEPPTGKPELLWCEISDVQLGTRVELEKMGGINQHDWAIFLTKLARWETEVTATIRERRAAVPLEGVVLAMLGDIVDGHGIFRGQAYELDFDVYKQVVHGANDFAQAIARIVAAFPDVRFTLYGVGGNHGRVGSYGEAPYRCNWDLVLYHIIELRIGALGLPNVTCHFPQSGFQVVEPWGWTHLLVHGDDIKGWAGLPFYGLQRAVAKYQQVLQKPVNFVHVGHFHAASAISSSLGETIINGNWIGANSFSKVIVEANTPVQLIHGITEENGITWTRKVYLRTREDMKPRITIYRHGVRRPGRAAS